MPAYELTPEIEQILSVHQQLWENSPTITYKDQTASSYQPSHQGYRSVILNNAKGVPHLWITHNMNKSTYGSQAIARADAHGERLRITWIVRTFDQAYEYVGRIETHEYFDIARTDRIHIETYSLNNVHVVYTTSEVYDDSAALYGF